MDRPADDARITTVLGELRRAGGFNALDAAAAAPAGAGWTSFAAFYGSPALVDGRMDLVDAAHRPAERRVSASVLHLGVASRVVSPVLAAACLGVLLELPADRLFWDLAPGSMLPLRAVAPRGRCVDGAAAADVAAALRPALVEEHLRPLGAAVRGRVRVAERLLWGNAAAAVGGAVLMLSRLRPDLADRAAAIGAALIAEGPMRGLGEVLRPDPRSPERRFARRTCCLLYRAPRGDVCGDCSLRGGAGD
ncbi:ferric iron reductase FhuF-like transporter [Murinocardiopsis flavida]|uniref:Ferric iron reductase FhuF-like transporter n=1 Tax=Murinocardiopsis flavida TaxID=645275 RepID=A0A2P8D262_9ACTN|nr:(2Fe-2S)-binding protein [Murinocardiopsis flavida]PSK91289.1 ferric iron reductase FhuF-like transporter [Murinocardiopsis flavida]